jgi:Spy/CpxP family protein refolding chaperone
MKNRTRAVAVVVAVLLIGCILGVAGYHFFFEKRDQPKPAVSNSGHVSGHAGRLVERLQLTKEQEKQLGEILEDSRRQIETGRNEFNSKMQEIRGKTNERIAAILNDEQKQKFQQILIAPESHGGSANQGGGHGHHE